MGGWSRAGLLWVKALFQLHQNGALAPRNQAFPVAAVARGKAYFARLITDNGAFAVLIGGFERPVITEDTHDILVVIMHGGGLIWTPAIDPNRDAPVVQTVVGALPGKGQGKTSVIGMGGFAVFQNHFHHE